MRLSIVCQKIRIAKVHSVCTAKPSTMHPSDLEPPERTRQRKRSLYVVYFACLAMSLGQSIMTTGTLPYLKRVRKKMQKDKGTQLIFQLLPSVRNQEKLMYSYAVLSAALPLSQVFCPTLFGWLSNRMASVRPVGILTGVLGIVASVLMALLSLFPEDWRFELYFLSKFLSGAALSKAPKLIEIRQLS